MGNPTIGHDPFANAAGMDAYLRAITRYDAPLPAPEKEPEREAGRPPASRGPLPRRHERRPRKAARAERDASASAPSAGPARVPMPAEPARTAARPDGALDLPVLWARGRRALALRGQATPGHEPWIESPAPPLQADFKLFPVKRRAFTGSFVERLGRWMRLLPRDFTAVIDDFGRDAAYEAAVVPFFDFLYRRWFRVQTMGFENVPSEGRTLIASNHTDWLVMDAAMIEVAIQNYHPARREVRALVDRFTAKLPWWNVFLSRTGQVLGCPENLLKLLQREELVLVFPEGARGATKPFRERHRVTRFGKGFARMAILTGTPIIPVAVEGFEELHPVISNPKGLARRLGLPDFPITPTFPWLGPLGLVPPPVKCSIEFGRPILTEGYPEGAADDEEVVTRLADKVRFIVQDLYEHLRARRKSRLKG
jgi:1-acyl-sn-glycerol-3-phosphate acyltransferase